MTSRIALEVPIGLEIKAQVDTGMECPISSLDNNPVNSLMEDLIRVDLYNWRSARTPWRATSDP